MFELRDNIVLNVEYASIENKHSKKTNTDFNINTKSFSFKNSFLLSRDIKTNKKKQNVKN